METTENIPEKGQKKIDYLSEDPIIKGQEWICVSFLSPEGVKNCKVRGFKFRGAFGTRQEAEAHAKEIQAKLDPDFHVFVGEGFKWLPWDQDPETVENQEYHEEELNNLMKSVKENLLLKKQHENERKKQCIQEAMEKNNALKSRNTTKERLQRKLVKRRGADSNAEQPKPITDKTDEVEATQEDKTVVPDIKDVEATVHNDLKKVVEDEKIIENEKKEVKEINTSLHKLEEMYAKILAKSKKQ